MGVTVFETPRGPVVIRSDEDRTAMHQMNGGFEKETLDFWARSIEPGDLAVDAGAYTGIYSIVAAKVGAKVVAFEPLPRNATRLRENIKLNAMCSAVEVYIGGLSDREGSAVIRYNGNLALTSGATVEHGIDHVRRHRTQVTLFRLDALALSSVAIMKIDVEGHERSVLRGAQNILKRDRPVLIVETLTETSRDQVAALLSGHRLVAVLDGRNAVFEPT
jgi:FkbM family methyltransferase